MSVLITGGTGSFGQAYAKHLLEFGEDRVCIYSRDEHKQAVMRERFNSPKLRFFIGDVRDRDRLRRAMEGCDTVIHAAALKRIEVGHYNPVEMVKTNVLGAVNVIEASQDAGVLRVVALSTDKAYQPVSPYGQSKALAESIFLAANNTVGISGPVFVVTRYGNVAGSAGSVIPKWREQHSQGEHVDVTNPECTRFWMTMNQAVALVVLATTTDKNILIPTLPAYRLGDLAEAMKVEYRVTRLPAWEKMHECMGDGNCSNTARRMTVDELREALRTV